MIVKKLARVAILTAVIGVHITSVLCAVEPPPPPPPPPPLPPSTVDDDYEGKYIDAVELSKIYLKKIQEQSDLFDALVKLVGYEPSEEHIDPDFHHCVLIKKDAADELLSKVISLFLDQCVESLQLLEEAVHNRLKDFLGAIKSLDQLAYEDALACMQLGNLVKYERTLECLDSVMSYRELSFYDYLEEIRQNYQTFNNRVKKLSECGKESITLIEIEIQTLIRDLNKCLFRIENIETFFEANYDEDEEWSDNGRKTVVKDIVTFSLSIIMGRIEELNKQLERQHPHEEVTDLTKAAEILIARNKEGLESIGKTAMMKVENTESMGAQFNQCTAMIAEEINIRMTLAIASINECLDESRQIHAFFTDGIASYGKEIEAEFEKQKELILTCTGKLIADMNSPSAEEVTQAVNCIKFKLLFTSDKSFVDLEERVHGFFASTREKISHFDNNLERVNICTRAAVFNFEKIMEDNSDLIDLCVEEKSSQNSEKDEL